MNIELENNKIYKGNYILNDINYFCFFKKTKNGIVDVITNEIIDFEKIYMVHHIFDISFYKLLRLKYKKTKDKNLFKELEAQTYHLILYYSKILRFFNLDDLNLIKDKNTEKEILNRVIEKIQKYSKRYIGQQASLIYAEQLKKFNNLKEIFSFLPNEFLEKVNPFWVDVLKGSQEFIFSSNYPLDLIESCNKFDYNLYDIENIKNTFDQKIENLKSKILKDKTENYRQKAKTLLNRKILEANETLENEIIQALKTGDSDLLKEISIIQDKIKEIENNLDLLLSKITPDQEEKEWFPELLYPFEKINIDYNLNKEINFETNEDVQSLYYIKNYLK
jgi:hypothetical protein